MKTTRIRLMELAGLREADESQFTFDSIQDLMDMAKGLKSFKKISDTKFELETIFLGDKRTMQVEPIPGKPSRMKVKYNSDPAEEVSTSTIYNTIYHAARDADFENNRLGSKSKTATKKPSKGVRVRDDEGEAVTTLTDITSQKDLIRKIAKEPEEYQQVWAEIPFAFDVVGPDSMYKTTDADVEDLEHYPPATYEEWIKGYRDWAKEVLASK
jgi:hypothetical protein